MTGYNIVGEGTFLQCVEALKEGKCACIYGPKGGILKLDKNECLVIRIDDSKLYFSADCYLGVWRKLTGK